MSQLSIQHSFNTGEWAPALNARVDLAKYYQGAALLRNFFVDYRGGASTVPGTEYIIKTYKTSTVRLLPFQASFSVSYVLEFGDQYIRFISNGAPILEGGIAITAATNTNPLTITVPGHTYHIGDWIFVLAVAGMTQINNKYFIISNVAGNVLTLTDLFGANVNATGYGVYTSGGTSQRVYTIPSPYLASELSTIKYAQNVNTLALCHTAHVPYILTLISAANWTLNPIVFGASISPPGAPTITTTLGAGSVNYAYVVTSVDANGQESGPSAPGLLASKLDLRTTGGSNTITWTPVSGAQFYNVYKAEPSYAAAVPSGVSYGFIGFSAGASFIDTSLDTDFSETPPIAQNPFQGAGVQSITQTAVGAYTVVPGVTIGAAPAGGQTATATAVLQVQGTPAVAATGSLYQVGDIIPGLGGVTVVVASVGGGGAITAIQPISFPGSNPGTISGVGNTVPANPVIFANLHGGAQAQLNLTWGVGQTNVTNPGDGYITAPAVTYSAGAATAAAVLGTASLGNPAVPIYFNQRLVLAGPLGSPQTFYMSKPGAYFNFDISNPPQPDDAITGTLVSGQLNTIKSMLPMPSGLVTFSDRSAWQINGGQPGVPVAADSINATSQAYNGASDVPPILATFDILYVQSKGSIVRDLSYNLYANIYTGTDISVISSHLFYGHTITGWAFAEEPFKTVWAVRDDGIALVLTFMKEQDLIAWAHRDTINGFFRSVASVTESVSFGAVDAVYFVVDRAVNGVTVKYIERNSERIFPNGAADAWCVDAGLQYNGAPASTFTGGEHLAGIAVTGLADGVVIPPFVMPASGNFTLSSPASKVTVGIGFPCQLQTLQLDTGDPTIQSKEKKIASVTVRCQDTLGLSIGSSFSTLVAMKDLVVGNVGSMTNQVVTGLVTGDAKTTIDPSWTVPGQYCIQQSQPLPASILGVIPNFESGDVFKVKTNDQS